MSVRVKELQRDLRECGLDALVVSSPANIRYLCHATGTACELLVPAEGTPLLLNNFVDITENAETATGVQQQQRTHPARDIADAVRVAGMQRVGLEAHFMSKGVFDEYVAQMPEVDLVPTSGLVEQYRSIKDDDEIEWIQRGMSINDVGMQYVVDHAREGMTERELAIGIEHAMRQAGADRLAFLLVQFGENAAKPHHQFSERALQSGDFILVDIGAVCNGYGSDTTRTFIFGEANDRQRAVYQAVQDAQQEALALLRSGVSAEAVHQASVDVIGNAGYADYYGHGLGHGINEGPRLMRGSTDTLTSGNVVTIEPGIYIPKWGGVRIEDTVVITDDGHRNLAGFSKELTIIS